MNQLIELQYFGPIISFIYASRSSHIILEQQEHWHKMSFRNRCQVLGAGNLINLSVPLVGGRDQRGLTRGIKIDYSNGWQVQHWRTLETCYNRSPFFEHYASGLKPVIFGEHEYLGDLNLAVFQWTLHQLKLQKPLSLTEVYEKTTPEDYLDLRDKFRPSNRQFWSIKPYQQVYGNVFEPNLSILDLLFNLGGQTRNYLDMAAAAL